MRFVKINTCQKIEQVEVSAFKIESLSVCWGSPCALDDDVATAAV